MNNSTPFLVIVMLFGALISMHLAFFTDIYVGSTPGYGFVLMALVFALIDKYLPRFLAWRARRRDNAPF